MKKLVLFFVILITNFFLLFYFASFVFAGDGPPPSYYQRKTLNLNEQKYNTESGEVPCPKVNLKCQDRSGTNCFNSPGIYTTPDGSAQDEMRGVEAGFDFNFSAKGIHCAQVKGTPIILNESSLYCLGTAGCYDPSWAGELQMPKNLKIPFAEEMGDHWAGTFDTEHLTLDEFDNLITRATQNVSVNPGTGYLSMAALEDKVSAQNEINQSTGVLQKLLTQGEQDELKCNFAKWAQGRYKAGYYTLYMGYAPDGKALLRQLAGACRNKVCPVGMPDRNVCLENYDSGKYIATDAKGNKFAPGPAWQKMGLIPNEKSTGQLVFRMENDKIYPLDVPYPQVFRMGLAANELFRIFTSKDKQDEFYNNFQAGAYKNLRENPLDKKNPGADNLWDITGEEMVQAPSQKTLVQNQPASPQEILKTKNKNSLVPQQNKTKSFLTKAWIFFQQAWPKVEVALAKTAEKNKPLQFLLAQIPSGPDSGTPPSEPPSVGSPEDFGTVSDTGGSSATCKKLSGSNGSCGKNCENNQVNPSDTTVWPKDKPFMHTIFGVKVIDPEQGTYSYEGVNKVQYPYLDGEGTRAGWCGIPFQSPPKMEVAKTRLVDVYNKVPFLASAWIQSADPVWGFMSNTKPADTFGSSAFLPNDTPGCTLDQNIVLDENGNFKKPNAAFIWDYRFEQFSPPYTYTDSAEGYRDGMKVDLAYDDANNLNRPNKPYQGKILFYQLGGLCNANKWWTQRVLNPLLKTLASAGTTGASTSTLDCRDQRKIDLLKVCTQNGAINDPNFANKIWTWDFCKEVTEPEPANCEAYRQYFIDHPNADDDEAQAATNCPLAGCKGDCRSCPEGNKAKGCGMFWIAYNKKGSDILSGKADSCVPP